MPARECAGYFPRILPKKGLPKLLSLNPDPYALYSLRVKGSCLRVQALGSGARGSGIRGWGFGVRGSGFGRTWGIVLVGVDEDKVKRLSLRWRHGCLTCEVLEIFERRSDVELDPVREGGALPCFLRQTALGGWVGLRVWDLQCALYGLRCRV
jgi:hypothetical protein